MTVWYRLILVGVSLCALPVLAGSNTGRLYGKITTVDGDVYQGYIRWDKNEASWVDVLNGDKQLPDRDREPASRRRRQGPHIEIFGLTIGGSEGIGSWSVSAQSGLRFGNVKSIRNIDDETALIEFKSGDKIELSGGSTDIGTDIRQLVVEDERQGETELSWDDLDRVDFAQAKGDAASMFGDRLYGTVTTRRGDEFTGLIGWDVDETLTNDLLEGSEKGRDRKIRFDKIASIARYSSSASSVKLTSGDELVLRGSNDVDDSNRGIVISDPGLGQVTVSWDEFDRLDFLPQDRPVRYDDFDGGRPLRGTVYTEDGDKYAGTIRWDDDEEYTWELLNGEYHDLEFSIEFGLIKEIARHSTMSSSVTLFDGRTFVLRGSNDVDEDNKGIFVKTDNGREIRISWDEFNRLELAGR
jgi:hypothetical protein